MGRSGQHKTRESGPERKCIATGKVRPKSALIRFVISPDGKVVPDLSERLPGRGIWVMPEREALDRAETKGLFARAAGQAGQMVAGQKLTVPEGLADLLERQLAERIVTLISLARKSGDAVTGFERVRDWLQKEEAEVLIQASDGSERGKSKLSTPYGGSFIGWLTSAELGQAFGRDSAVHAVLRSGGLSQRVVEESAKLKGLRVSNGEASPERKK